MKKIGGLIFLLVLSALLFTGCNAQLHLTAKEGEKANGFLWENSYDEITITGYEGNQKNLTIPETINGKEVTCISQEAFSGFKTMTSVTIPKTMKTIGFDAFKDCTSLKVVNWNAVACETANDTTAVNTENQVFAGCTSLEKVVFGKEVVSIPSCAFEYVDSLHEVTFSEGLEEIGTFAFRNTNLKGLSLPSSVKSIGTMAFLSALKDLELVLPASLETMEANPFPGCGVKSISIPAGNEHFKVEGNCCIDEDKWLIIGSEKSVIPTDGSVNSIMMLAFHGVKGLKEITVPNAVSYIASYAFAYCEDLESISISSNVSKIGDEAFSGCPKLKKVVFNGLIEEIGAYAFMDCTALATVEFKSASQKDSFGITLGEAAFRNCSSLVKLDAPLGTIPDYCFQGCTSLKTVKFGIIQSLGNKFSNYCFDGCKNLEIKISGGTKEFGWYAFRGCDKIKYEADNYYNWYKVDVNGNVTYWDSLSRLRAFDITYYSNYKWIARGYKY